MQKSPATPLIYSAQYLRFVAATMVGLVHAFEIVPEAGRGDMGGHFNLGAAGVDIFFVISGFIMCFITMGGRERTAKSFLLHRLVRVAPPYWAVTVLMAAIVLVMPQIFNSSRLEPAHLASSFLFFAWPHPVMGDAMPLYFPGWTLNYEAFFYIIFAFFLTRALEFRIAAVSCLFVFLVGVGFLMPVDNEIYKFYTKPILIEFIFGMSIAYVFVRGKSPAPALSITMIIAGIILFVAGAVYWPVARLAAERCLVWGIPAALLVGGTLFLDARKPIPKIAPLKILGDASYAMYLTHFFVTGAFSLVWSKLHLSTIFPDIVLILTCIVTCWCVGIAYHFIFERPVVNFLRKMIDRKPSPVLSSAS